MEQNAATLVYSFTAIKYTTFAAFSFLMYDHALTIHSEVEYVWKRRWSFGKIIFIVNRFFGPFVLLYNLGVYFSHSLTDKFCSGFTIWSGLSCTMALMIAEIILQARIYAVYNRNKKLLVVLCGLFLLASGGGVLIPSFGMPLDPGHFSSLRSCYSTFRPPYYSVTWVPPLAYETVLCFVILYKAWTTHRDGGMSSLLTSMILDSFLYFLMIFAVLLVNCLIWALAPQAINLGIGWVVAVPCVAASRLQLNVRERYFMKMAISHDHSHIPLDAEDKGSVRGIRGLTFARVPPSSTGTGTLME